MFASIHHSIDALSSRTISAAENDGLMAVFGGFLVIIYLAIVVVMIASMWKVFTKAGKPGWGCIIPIYNVILMLEIAVRPVWWIILYFIPIVNWVIGIIVINDISKAFGKGVGTTLGLIFLPFIFWPILGFGSARYIGIQRPIQ
jgi:uncharacterized membrane protein YhaH (DUF805 family)